MSKQLSQFPHRFDGNVTFWGRPGPWSTWGGWCRCICRPLSSSLASICYKQRVNNLTSSRRVVTNETAFGQSESSILEKQKVSHTSTRQKSLSSLSVLVSKTFLNMTDNNVCEHWTLATPDEGMRSLAWKGLICGKGSLLGRGGVFCRQTHIHCDYPDYNTRHESKVLRHASQPWVTYLHKFSASSVEFISAGAKELDVSCSSCKPTRTIRQRSPQCENEWYILNGFFPHEMKAKLNFVQQESKAFPPKLKLKQKSQINWNWLLWILGTLLTYPQVFPSHDRKTKLYFLVPKHPSIIYLVGWFTVSSLQIGIHHQPTTQWNKNLWSQCLKIAFSLFCACVPLLVPATSFEPTHKEGWAATPISTRNQRMFLNLWMTTYVGPAMSQALQTFRHSIWLETTEAVPAHFVQKISWLRYKSLEHRTSRIRLSAWMSSDRVWQERFWERGCKPTAFWSRIHTIVVIGDPPPLPT